MISKKKAILIVGHGSQLNKSNQDFEDFVKIFSQYSSIPDIQTCYLEFVKPSLQQALIKAAIHAKEIIVIPLFLFAARHVKKDVPMAVNPISKLYPQANIKIRGYIGIHSNMVQLVSKRLKESIAGLPKKETKISVLIIGRGSGDSDASADFCKLVGLVEESTEYHRVAYCYIAMAKPTIEEALKKLIHEKPEVILIQPYLLFEGHLKKKLDKLTAQYSKAHPKITFKISKTLGQDPLVFDVLKERILKIEMPNEL